MKTLLRNNQQTINWSEISRRLTGSRNNLKTDKLPKRFKEPFKELNDFVEQWLEKYKEV